MLKKLKSVKKHRGFTLLELMLVLSIGAVLLIMATRYYMSAKQTQQINDAVSMVSGVMSGAANYSTQNNGSYTGMSLLALVKGGYVPASLCGSDSSSCPGSNPWHGNITVTPSTSSYQIVMNNISSTGVCESVANMVNSAIQNTQLGGNLSKASCSGNTLTAVIN